MFGGRNAVNKRGIAYPGIWKLGAWGKRSTITPDYVTECINYCTFLSSQMSHTLFSDDLSIRFCRKTA
jgi:hypothetical protein